MDLGTVGDEVAGNAAAEAGAAAGDEDPLPLEDALGKGPARKHGAAA
jgi:hypothetical protein